MILGNWLWPSSLRQLFCAASTSLNTIASAVLFERQPFERIVRCRTVAKVLSIGFEVLRCFQCSAGKSCDHVRQSLADEPDDIQGQSFSFAVHTAEELDVVDHCRTPSG